MKGETPDRMDSDLRALLDTERSAAPPAAALARVWSRIASGLPPLDPRGGGGTTGRGGIATASRMSLVAAAAFLGGGIVGAGVHAGLQKAPPERIVYVERPAPALSATTLAVADSAPPAKSTATAPLTPPVQTSVHPPPSSSSLAAERTMLDEARGALTSGDAVRALGLLDAHARRFAKPQLGEEREALAIQALVTAGRYDDARARAATFRAAVPNSLFLPSIDASLASIP
jgi:hypothetical protein